MTVLRYVNGKQTWKSLNRQNGFRTTLERLSCHKDFKITQAETKVSFFYLNPLLEVEFRAIFEPFSYILLDDSKRNAILSRMKITNNVWAACAFTEFYLQPLARELPSFIEDTTDLLNRIEDLNRNGPFPEGTLLVSWDVVSMFPNIDNQLGLTAVRKALNARENQLPSTNCILEAVEICLKSNHSVFKENSFLQIHGTAMGPKNACSYADLAMGEIDFQAKFSGPIKPALWWRYRDDVFDLW